MPLHELSAEDMWSVSTGEHEGNPMLVRVNTSAAAYACHPELRARFGVAVPLNEPGAHGLPGKAEVAQLDEIEDSLCKAMGADGRLVLVITTGGMREFVSYVRSVDAAERAMQAVHANITTHELQHYTATDPQWDVYAQFV